MALVKCSVCGKNVNTTAKNYVFANDIHQHVKCPKASNAPQMNEQEKLDRKELTDAIKWLCVKYDKPANWSLITAQIKRLKEAGHDYVRQLNALKWLVEKDGEFWGYGRLEKFIDHYIQYEQRLAEFKKEKIVDVIDNGDEKIAVKKAPTSHGTFFDMGDLDI